MSQRCLVSALVLWLWTTLVVARPALPDFTALVERNAPAVVNISTRYHHRPDGMPDLEGLDSQDPLGRLLRRFFGDEESLPRESESLGSGFIISPDGYILTAHHVVEEADEIIVRLTNRDEYPARVVGSDPASDVALIKVDGHDLPTVEIGDSDTLKIGAWVLAIGSPFGFDSTVTAGIVSAKGRSLPAQNYVPYIQTDAAINPGNSGGPLFDLDGKVVGITTQIFSRSGGFMGLSFAVPINLAMEVAEQLRTRGRVSRGYLGVMIQDLDHALARAFGLAHPRGALVTQVLPDSPAQRAGLRAGDVILAFNGMTVRDSGQLPPMVGLAPVGKGVTLEIQRDGERRQLQVVLAELPEALDETSKPASAGEKADTVRRDRLGLVVGPLSPERGEAAGLPPGQGVVVTEVHPGPARRAGIEPGDLLLMIAGRSVTDVKTYRRLVAELDDQGEVPVLVQREDGPLFLALDLGHDGH